MKEKAFRAAWKILPTLPSPVVNAGANAAGTVVWALNPESVKQMRRNFTHLLGDAPEERQVRRAVQSYFRCFAQQFSLPGWSKKRIRDALIYPDAQALVDCVKEGPTVVALTHSGNWDIAGAWFCQEHNPVITVAEKLEPEELFNQFVSFRESLGMTILGAGKGEHVFERLVETVRDKKALVPLLADRDITGRGIEVRLGASKALVAAGPAALALRLNRPLFAGYMSYEKHGNQWDVRAHFHGPITLPEHHEGLSDVEALTQAWVDAIEDDMVAHVVDWHMMQRLFVEDLDPDRLRRARDKVQQ